MTADPAAHAPESQPDSAVRKPLPSYTDADLRTLAEFKERRERAEITQAEMARRFQLSPSAYNGLEHAQYKGDKAKYIGRMRAMIDRQKAREAATPRPPFQLLSNSVDIFGFIARCDANRQMGFLRAQEGGCKTMHLTEFARVNPDSAIYLSCLKGQAPRDLCATIAEAIGLDGVSGSQATIINVLIRRLDALGQPVLLVDECDDLGPSGLRVLQQIYDKSGSAIVLAGTVEFLRDLRRRKAGTAGQALSRMRHFTIAPISDADARDLLEGFNFSEAAFNALWTAAKRDPNSPVDVRRLIDAAKFARDEAGKGRQIGLPHVAEALKTEMPRDI